MPPKKRNRDGEENADDALDLNEVKEMHRAAILREADLHVRNEQLEEEKEKATVHCFKLLLLAVSPNIKSRKGQKCISFPNPLLRGLVHDVTSLIASPETVRFHSVDTWTEVKDLFRSGLAHGTQLQTLEELARVGGVAWVVVLLIPTVTNKDIVVAGEESRYVVCMCTTFFYSQLFVDHLYHEQWKDESAWMENLNAPKEFPAQLSHVRCGDLVISDAHFLEELKKQPYNGKLEKVWVATDDNPETGSRCDVDLDTMTVTSRADGSRRNLSWSD